MRPGSTIHGTPVKGLEVSSASTLSSVALIAVKTGRGGRITTIPSVRSGGKRDDPLAGHFRGERQGGADVFRLQLGIRLKKFGLRNPLG
jgi:hypothetical protein